MLRREMALTMLSMQASTAVMLQWVPFAQLAIMLVHHQFLVPPPLAAPLGPIPLIHDECAFASLVDLVAQGDVAAHAVAPPI
jgi:hypothetical protein